MPVYEPLNPNSLAILISLVVVPSPGSPLVLLIFESMVSAGWDTMAAAKPAINPDPRLTAVWAPSDMDFLSQWE